MCTSIELVKKQPQLIGVLIQEFQTLIDLMKQPYARTHIFWFIEAHVATLTVVYY
jgi:hypothetical protein